MYHLFVWPSEWREVATKGGRLRYSITHNVIDQSKNWIVCVSLASRTCIVWHNMLSRICWSTGRHFKHSVDTSITVVTERTGSSQGVGGVKEGLWKMNVWSLGEQFFTKTNSFLWVCAEYSHYKFSGYSSLMFIIAITDVVWRGDCKLYLMSK